MKLPEQPPKTRTLLELGYFAALGGDLTMAELYRFHRALPAETQAAQGLSETVYQHIVGIAYALGYFDGEDWGRTAINLPPEPDVADLTPTTHVTEDQYQRIYWTLIDFYQTGVLSI
jgi:hypothetical protein